MSPQVTKEVFVYLLGLVTPLSSCLRQSTVNFAAGKFAAACRLSRSEGKAYRQISFQLQGDNYANSFRAIGGMYGKKDPASMQASRAFVTAPALPKVRLHSVPLRMTR